MNQYRVSEQALKARVILVTGAGEGIGRQAALSYAAHGATVILLGRTVAKLEQTYDAIIAAGGPEPAIVPLDLAGASSQHYRDLAQTIENQFGRLDGLLHNAGLLGTLGPLQQLSISVMDDLWQVNVRAELMLTQALLPLIEQSPDGRIVFTSSTVGHQGRAYWGAYAISKFAVEGMMQVLADEMSHSTVRVNAINPGGTRTKMRASAFPAEDPQVLKTPADLMPLYLYLMAPEGRHLHGQCIDAQPKK
ncbi:putative oxidoreductase YciK [Vibrio stylophorae]|uniref:Oxidoreductase YciK n=1 Tax=Vibrio stylophorae TaxID=659351 RepID=A0ABM8ZRR7_9VIBR|nr:YciK family oxidoreductase [Vibrio stylophorae]CAH0532990.1 putative oxidoreductase YciK [Vibrio stylophorae]